MSGTQVDDTAVQAVSLICDDVLKQAGQREKIVFDIL